MPSFQANTRHYTNAGPVFWNPDNPNHQDVRPGSLGLLETLDSNAPMRPPTQHLVEVRDAGHMGLGLFAKVNIPRGARILAERPLFALPIETPLSNHGSDHESNIMTRRADRDIEKFIRHIDLKGLDSEEVKAMEALYCNEEEAQDEDTKDTVRKYLFDRMDQTWPGDNAEYALGLELSMFDMPQVPDNFGEVDRYTRLYAIWTNNRIQLGEGASMDSGVFLLASRINHSCCPNALYDFNPHTGNREPRIEMLTMHAIRDLAAGEQILVSYDAVLLKLREERTRQLATWNIRKCLCALCTDPVVEALQQRAHVLWQAADCWVNPWPSAMQRLYDMGIAQCEDAFEALKMGEEVIALLTHPVWNVREKVLAEAYKLCSILCERIAIDEKLCVPWADALNYWEKAMRFSGEKCQVYMLLVGTDGREMKKADERFKELGARRATWTALQQRWQWPPRA